MSREVKSFDSLLDGIINQKNFVRLPSKRVEKDSYTWSRDIKRTRERRLCNPSEICLNQIEEQINYIYIDVLHDSKRKIKKILKKIMSLNYVVSYYNNNNMLYIFSENLVFGVDLNICEFIGLSKDKIIDKVNTLSDVTLYKMKYLINVRI